MQKNLERDPGSAAREDIVKWTGLALVGGGLDTVSILSWAECLQILNHIQTMATVYSFILAMTLYPEVQKKAQAEIDAVIGHDRLPTFQDRDHLPYIGAICLELLRWMPVGPLGRS